MSRTKIAEPIQMPFRGLTQVGPTNHVLDGGHDRTNPFSVVRDEMAMRLFAKLLGHLLKFETCCIFGMGKVRHFLFIAVTRLVG